MNNETIFTATELCIKAIWLELLAVPKIDPRQTFFELGGDSSIMIDMLSRVNEALGTEVGPSLLFEDATLHGFAALVEITRSIGDSMEEGII